MDVSISLLHETILYLSVFIWETELIYKTQSIFVYDYSAGCNTACGTGGRLQIACNDVFCFTPMQRELTES
jgi:hypothetical protein